jgi:hypothetical protein
MFRVFIPIAVRLPGELIRTMANERARSLITDAAPWARRCHIEAARAIHPSTKAFLLELAAEYEALSGETVDVDPDDTELQNAVADRLAELAAKRRAWFR